MPEINLISEILSEKSIIKLGILFLQNICEISLFSSADFFKNNSNSEKGVAALVLQVEPDISTFLKSKNSQSHLLGRFGSREQIPKYVPGPQTG